MKIKKILIGLIILAVLITVAEFSVIRDIFGMDGENAEVVIEIEKGEGLKSIAQKLKEKNIIDYENVFYYCVKNDYPGFQFGRHILSDDMSYKQISSELSTLGDVESVSVVIPEGYELRQIAEEFAKTGIFTAEDFMQSARGNKDFLRGYTRLRGAVLAEDVEGYLFPATYEVSLNCSTSSVFIMMTKAFLETYTHEDSLRAEELGMTDHELITLASIIEREAANESEHKKVAGVFYNRLKSGMKLQSCATVQYILKERKPVLSIADTEINSPYNTYMYEGLPPGPIASPGKSAIEAALWPEEHDYYYFVAKADGSGHVFSKTFEEHQRAVSQNQ